MGTALWRRSDVLHIKQGHRQATMQQTAGRNVPLNACMVSSAGADVISPSN